MNRQNMIKKGILQIVIITYIYIILIGLLFYSNLSRISELFLAVLLPFIVIIYLIYSTQYPFKKKVFILILGRRSTGKTVFLTMLMKKLMDNNRVKLEYDEGFAYIRSNLVHLENEHWPSPTLPKQEYKISLNMDISSLFGRINCTIQTIDIAGEDFSHFLSITDNYKRRKMFPEIFESNGIILLIDHRQAKEMKQDYYKILNILSTYKYKIERPIAVVVVKTDMIDDFRDPETFVKNNYKNLYHIIRDRCENARFFGANITTTKDDNQYMPQIPLSGQGQENVIAWILLNM